MVIGEMTPFVAPDSRWSRPSWVWALVALYAGGGVGLLMGVLAPLSDVAPVRFEAWLGVACFGVAAAVYGIGERIGHAGMVVLPLVGTIIVTVLVISANTRAGLVMTAFGYPWPGLYVGYYLGRRAVHANALLAAVGYGGALAHSGESRMVAVWVIVVGTVWVMSYVLACLVGQLRAQAERDQLTGLSNRPAFMAAAATALAQAQRTGSPLSIAVLDLDRLKLVNDREGHAAGDLLLAGVASAWRGELRRGDVLARFGGDEFVLLLPDSEQPVAAGVVARFALATDTPFSVGIAQLRADESLTALIGRADAAMYADKKLRRRALHAS